MMIEMRTCRTGRRARERLLRTFEYVPVPEHRRSNITVLEPFPTLDAANASAFLPGLPKMTSRVAIINGLHGYQASRKQLEGELMPPRHRRGTILVNDPNAPVAW